MPGDPSADAKPNAGVAPTQARVMVLGAGLGTRLRPLTDELPKPLVPIGDRPLIEHVLGYLARQGYERAVVNTHHLPVAFVRARPRLPMPVDLVHEPILLGTAGGLSAARRRLGSPPVLVWNGDILAEPPMAALLGEATDGLCLAVAPRRCGEGTVGVDHRGRVVRLRGEVFGREMDGGDYWGIAAVGARCLATLPEQGCLIGDWALPELRRGGTVSAVRVEGPWTDIGTVQAYVDANLAWLRRGRLTAWRSRDARVEPSVELFDSVVGSGAVVSGRGRLERTVVWPGAAATAPLSDAVVMSSGRIVPVHPG